jgi:hypothetical protein
MAGIAILIIIAGCAVLMFLKGTVVRAFASIIVAILALVAAFSFFEFIAGFIISKADKGGAVSIVNLAQPISFALLFIIVFAGLQALVIHLTRDKVDLGLWPERIGRPVCGLILGFIVSGVLVTALAMAPLPTKYPYERFEENYPKPNSPKKVLLNVDGFVVNLFNTISKGSLSGKNSFAVLHPDYLDQVFLNRNTKDVSLLTSTTPAITVPIEKAVWPAPEAIKTQIDDLNSKGELNKSPGKPTGGYTPLIVRIGIKNTAVKAESKISAGQFSSSQMRLICKRSSELQNPLGGQAINVYPVGHLSTQTQLQASTEIKLDSSRDFADSSTREIDFVFCVPSNYSPVLAEFKLNNVVQIVQNAILKDASEAPEPANFYQRAEGEAAPGRGSGGGFPGGFGPGGRRGGRGMPGGQDNQNQQEGTPESKAQQLIDSTTGAGISDEIGL